MTDSQSPVKSQTALAVDPIAATGPAPLPPKGSAASRSADLPVDEEEDYTIKCICGFQDDDGNTVFCERCETWQHIQCYYFYHGTVPDVSKVEHSCADCDPRPLDAQAASERQSKRRNEFDPRKVKKTTTKSQKRKVKVSESLCPPTNGCLNERIDSHDRTSTGVRDLLPSAKRPKTSHRSSSSINSPLPLSNSNLPTAKTSSSIRNSRGSTDLPNHTPNDDYVSQPYSASFLDLYDDDPGDAPMQANLFNDITITRSLSSWSHDVESLREATNGLSPQDVFHRCDQPLDSMTLPRLHKEQKQDSSVVVDGRHPKWRFLTIDSMAPKDSIVGELKGKIGHMHDYVDDIANRWNYLRHPVPFVFFHPKLPIYIDTRREGSICRYLRRSCYPNLSMKTILENGSDYHFCFVAKHDLEAGTELTIGWVPDEHMRNIFRRSDEAKQEGTVDAEEDYVSDWVGKVLADFGGCACDSPSQCTLARYDRRNGRSKNHGSKLLSNGRIAKGRNGYASKPSPPSTVPPSNGRADSEVSKNPDEENDDNRSTSGSMRSKPRSRDMTPSRRNLAEPGCAPGVPLSDREKRKIAAVEKNFEQLEHGGQQPAQKKKKRNSGGPILNAPAAAGPKHPGHAITSFSQPNTPSIPSQPIHINSSAARRRSVSPVAMCPQNIMGSNDTSTTSVKRLPPLISPAVRKFYVDCAVQTEPAEFPPWDELDSPPKVIKRPYISLTKRLLLRCQRRRRHIETHKGDGLKFREELPNAKQQSSSSSLVEPTACPPSSGDVNITPNDSKVELVENILVLPPEHISFSVPLEKPRPPGQVSSCDDQLRLIETKSPTPPLQIPEIQSLPASPHSNGTCAENLLVPPSQPSHLTDEIAITSDRAPTPNSIPAVQTSNISHAFLPPNAGPMANVAHPSPVRKKLSVADYIKLVNTNKTETLPGPENQAVSSPTPKSVTKPESQAKSVAETTSGAVLGSTRAIADALKAGKDPKL